MDRNKVLTNFLKKNKLVMHYFLLVCSLSFRMASNSNGFDDMVELPQITEKDIGENLRVRLKKEVIYVSRCFVKN